MSDVPVQQRGKAWRSRLNQCGDSPIADLASNKSELGTGRNEPCRASPAVGPQLGEHDGALYREGFVSQYQGRICPFERP